MTATALYAISALYLIAAIGAGMDGKYAGMVCFLCFALSNVALSRMT